MKIAIWDIDWFHNKESIPNVKCMKLSSFHKQRKDEVFMVVDKFDIDFKYDRLYIVKEDENSGLPPPYLLTEPKTILIGRGFIYYKGMKVPTPVMACRPDYQLYPKIDNDGKGNSYERAEFITFFANGKRLDVRQDFRNAAKRKRLIVADEEFWIADEFDMSKCLKELLPERSIVFLHPISLKVLLTNEEIQLLFLKLHFAPGTIFKWQNDYGSSIEDSDVILKFMLRLQEITHSKLGKIPFKAAIYDQREDRRLWKKDLLRCLQIAYNFKTARVQYQFSITEPQYIHSSKLLLYKILEDWHYYHDLSFIEFCVHKQSLKTGASWYGILRSPKRWKDPRVEFIVFILSMSEMQEELELFALQWGDNIINTNKIDFEIIEKQCSLLMG